MYNASNMPLQIQEIPINEDDHFQLVLQLHYKDLQSILPSSVKCSDTGILKPHDKK